MVSREELSWAAGLFEGEGTAATRERLYMSPVASVTMTDLDVLQKFQKIVGIGKIYGPYTREASPHWLPRYTWTVASYEEVQAIGAMLWGWLGPRRRMQFTTVMKGFIERPRMIRKRAGGSNGQSLVMEMFGKKKRELSKEEISQYWRVTQARRQEFLDSQTKDPVTW